MGKTDKFEFNINSFIKGSADEKKHAVTEENAMVVAETVPAPKPSAKKKPAKKKETVEIVPQTSMSYVQENIPYATAYNETNMQLDAAIHQLDMLGAETINELQTLRSNKTIRNKYNYINDMTANATSIISAKIGAIKEKNKTINDINHLELSRMKELKSTMNQEDDNLRVQSMYDAFINTPVGGGVAALGGLPVPDINVNNPNVNMVALGSAADQIAWEQSLDPAQNRMLLEAKGMIDTIVVYDNATGNRWFEVRDKQTGQVVPNVELPSQSGLYDLDINVRQGVAKDINRNVVYKLEVLNGSAGLDQY